jgi:hypothetical protein
VRDAGGIRSANAGMSNVNGREMRPHRKPKVSYAMVIIVGLVGA